MSRGINQTGVRSQTRRVQPQPYSNVRPWLPVFSWDMDKTYNTQLTDQDVIEWIRQFGTVTVNITSTTAARVTQLLQLVVEHSGGPWGPPRLLIIGAPYHRAPWNDSGDPDYLNPSAEDTGFASRDYDLGQVRDVLKKAVAHGILPHNIHIHYDCEVFYNDQDYTAQQLTDRAAKYLEMYRGTKAMTPLSPVSWYAAGWRRFTGNGSNNANLITPASTYPIMDIPAVSSDDLNYVWYRPKYPEAEAKCFDATLANGTLGQKVVITAWIGSWYEYSNTSGSAVSGNWTTGYAAEWGGALGRFCKTRQNDIRSVILYPGIHQGESLSNVRHAPELPARLAFHRALTVN